MLIWSLVAFWCARWDAPQPVMSSWKFVPLLTQAGMTTASELTGPALAELPAVTVKAAATAAPTATEQSFRIVTTRP